MSRFSLFIRNNLTDRALKPLRGQLASRVPAGSRVLDVGCANGRFLTEIAERIERGVGVDLDGHMIAYAQRTTAADGHTNLEFICGDAERVFSQRSFEPTVVTTALCLHEMVRSTALAVLQQFAAVSPRIIIADFVEPESWIQRVLLHIDEFVAAHHDRYVAYRDSGGMPSLLDDAQLEIEQHLPSKITGVHIWDCSPAGGATRGSRF